jgi:hypothetical protein
MLNTLLLNLPEFRWKRPEESAYVFLDIAEETLKDCNTQLINLAHRPKKLRIKYGNYAPYVVDVRRVIARIRYIEVNRSKSKAKVSVRLNRNRIRKADGNPRDPQGSLGL